MLRLLFIATAVPRKAFAAMGCELEQSGRLSTVSFFHRSPISFNHFEIGSTMTMPSTTDEGQHIVEALGNKKTAILPNHGILTVTKSVDAAAFLSGAVGRCIQAQVVGFRRLKWVVERRSILMIHIMMRWKILCSSLHECSKVSQGRRNGSDFE
jgi:hypothetical protein